MGRISVLGLVIGLGAACFNAPSDAVIFRCDPDSAPACPPGYTCEEDGCCHRDGSDVEEHFGACRLSGTDSGGTPTGSGTGTTGTEATSSQTSSATDTTGSQTSSATDTTETSSATDGTGSQTSSGTQSLTTSS